MGPNTLFDKSFLQSLTVDESIWFDNFFRANVCPLFFVETLGDLEKKVREGRKPEEEVRIIAAKFPEMRGQPNAYHHQLCIANLLGNPIAMTGQIYLPPGRLVKCGTEISTLVEQSPEAEAFLRWQCGEFIEVDRLFARSWRNALSATDLRELANQFHEIGIDNNNCKTIEQAKSLATEVCSESDHTFLAMKMALLLLRIPQEAQDWFLKPWANAGYPTLASYAPYAAHVLTVELFFRITLAANLLSVNRSSNRVDIAYLFYLPFCTLFVSSDRLHKKCAPLFLRKDQEFVWGQTLKTGLAELDIFYSHLPQEIRNQGVMSFALYPPEDKHFFVTQLWDRHVPGWRRPREFSSRERATAESYVKAQIREAMKAPSVTKAQTSSDPNEGSLIMKRIIKAKKGSWWQAPKNFKPGA